MDDDLRDHREAQLDETIEESFPASDPPANTVEVGVVAREIPPASCADVSDSRQRHRFELKVGSRVAFLEYAREPGTLTLVHTEVPERLRDGGIGRALVEAALETAHAEGRRVVAVCPFVKAYLRTHPG